MLSKNLTLTAGAAKQLASPHVGCWKPTARYSAFAVQLSVMATSTPKPELQPNSVLLAHGNAFSAALILAKAPPTRARNVPAQLLALLQLAGTAPGKVQLPPTMFPLTFCQSRSPSTPST